MKLYYSKGACSLASHIIINELEYECQYIAVNLKTHQLEDGSSFYTINPKGSVPVLEIEPGKILTENAVILQYLANTANNTKILPARNEFKHYQTLEWLNFISSDLHKGIGILFSPSLTENIKEEIFIPNIKKKMKYINDHLKNNLFLMGSQFTLPDAYLFVMISWLRHFKFELKGWENVSRYFEELLQRPSIDLSLKEEGLS